MQSLYEDLVSWKAILTIIVGILMSALVDLWPDIKKTLKHKYRWGEPRQNPTTGSPQNRKYSAYIFVLPMLALAATIFGMVMISDNEMLSRTGATYALLLLAILLAVHLIALLPFSSGMFLNTQWFRQILLITHTLTIGLIFFQLISPLLSYFVLSGKFKIPAAGVYSVGQQLSLIILLASNAFVVLDPKFSYSKDFGLKYLPLGVLCIFIALSLYLPAKDPVKKGVIINTFFKEDEMLNSFYDSLQLRN